MFGEGDPGGVEAADDDSQPARSRLTDIAQAIRGWAMTHPQRYLLLYGTPVPGYHAPDAATELARRIFAPVLAGFADSMGDSTYHRYRRFSGR